MTFTARLNIALAILSRTGLRPIVYAPPTHRLLWRLGVRIRPPHFSRWLANFLVGWLVFTPPVLLLLLLLSNDSVPSNVADSAQLGPYLAILAAGQYAKGAEDRGLPDWSELESPDQPFRTSSTRHWLRDS